MSGDVPDYYCRVCGLTSKPCMHTRATAPYGPMRSVGAGDGNTFVVDGDYYKRKCEQLERDLAAERARAEELNRYLATERERCDLWQKRADRLHAAIEQAPHNDDCNCMALKRMGAAAWDRPAYCDCWKARALEAST